MSYIGFVIGTVYQYGLLRLMTDIVLKNIDGVPAYKFDFPVMLISLVCFITICKIIEENNFKIFGIVFSNHKVLMSREKRVLVSFLSIFVH